MTRRALDLMQGTVDILILRTLAWEPMHGYAMAQFVRARTGGAITIESAALYQALLRQQQTKRVQSSCGLSATHRPAKFYELTPHGRS
jgi:PadR family transcriptional regulator PadR